PASEWGTALIAKIVAVALLVTLSLPRALAVAQLATTATGTAAVRDVLRLMYAVTALAIGAIVGLAIWLAHG
ncbi:MAG: hypothetical protein ACRDF0_03700, partial [Candidatus Limnocylindria bacterium]